MEKVHKSYNSLESDIEKELAELRKGTGLTPVKLQQKPVIRGLVSRLKNLPASSLTGSQIFAFLVAELAK